VSVAPIPRTRSDLAYNGLTIRVHSADSSHLSWLEEFLAPQFQRLEASAYECAVSLTANDQLFEEVLRKGARPDGGLVDCFALDSTLVQLPLWGSPGPDRIIFDPPFRVFYIVNADGTESDVLSRPDSLAARISLMRVVREFAMNQSHRKGRLIIHGAAFAVGDRAVIVAGPKRVGKTTLLIHALRAEGAAYVSNDRVVVSYDGPVPRLHGMPTVVTIRAHTLEMFPDLMDRLLDRAYHSRLSLSEVRAARFRPVQTGASGQFYLSPAQFCDLLQVASLAQAQVGALVFPRVTGSAGAIEVERVSVEVAATRLRACLFSAHSAQKVSAVFAPRGERFSPDQRTLEHLCHTLASHVPCFECRLGNGAYRSADSAARLIRDLFG